MLLLGPAVAKIVPFVEHDAVGGADSAAGGGRGEGQVVTRAVRDHVGGRGRGRRQQGQNRRKPPAGQPGEDDENGRLPMAEPPPIGCQVDDNTKRLTSLPREAATRPEPSAELRRSGTASRHEHTRSPMLTDRGASAEDHARYRAAAYNADPLMPRQSSVCRLRPIYPREALKLSSTATERRLARSPRTRRRCVACCRQR
jgi:hypothetical protein